MLPLSRAGTERDPPLRWLVFTPLANVVISNFAITLSPRFFSNEIIWNRNHCYLNSASF